MALERFREFLTRSSARKIGNLYVHYPCFDGIVSGVLAWQFLEREQNWKIECVCPVNYDSQHKWLTTGLSTPSAVVDFLYHPQAFFWADHHLTSFVDGNAQSDFERRKGSFLLFYDQNAGSTASLLWRHLAKYFGETDRYKEMVDWAEKIDSAGYSSVQEAILGDAPALRINFSLMANDETGQHYCDYLVRRLRSASLTTVADLPEVSTRYDRVHALMTRGLERLRNSLTYLEDIVAFDIEATEDAIVSRYAPYYFFPNALYSIGITRYPTGAKITAMRNPWRDFRSVPLGTIFQGYGGGGHQRVASVFLSGERSKDAESVADQLLFEIRSRQVSTAPEPEALSA